MDYQSRSKWQEAKRETRHWSKMQRRIETDPGRNRRNASTKEVKCQDSVIRWTQNRRPWPRHPPFWIQRKTACSSLLCHWTTRATPSWIASMPRTKPYATNQQSKPSDHQIPDDRIRRSFRQLVARLPSSSIHDQNNGERTTSHPRPEKSPSRSTIQSKRRTGPYAAPCRSVICPVGELTDWVSSMHGCDHQKTKQDKNLHRPKRPKSSYS